MEKMKAYLKKIDEVIANGKYKDNWQSLDDHPVPNWYRNAKFGIFIHWGPYAVPAYGNEWYPRFMYEPPAEMPTPLIKRGIDVFKHHVETYGPHKYFGYKDFIPMFKAEKFDPSEWADLFKETGARFVMPVAEHHDGFQMYDSDLSEWCATKKGPCKDVLGMLKEEIEKRDMVFTASSHRVEHYWFFHGGKEFESDIPQDVPYGDIYWPAKEEPFDMLGGPLTNKTNIYVDKIDEDFMEDWLARTCELVDKYRPKIVYFDWWIQIVAMKPYLKKFAAYYYNRALEWGEEVTINYKCDAYAHTTAIRDIERGQLSDTSPYFWQDDTAVAKYSWCYTENNNYKEPRDVICDLVDVVSKNGSLLLNIGPKADGTIPKEDRDILNEIGKWMKVNSEGIYDTFPWRKNGEGSTKVPEGFIMDRKDLGFSSEDFRFTYKDGAIYAFCMRWPSDGAVRINSFGIKAKDFNAVIKNVKVLGAEDRCSYTLCNDYLSVIADDLVTDNPVCIKIEID